MTENGMNSVLRRRLTQVFRATHAAFSLGDLFFQPEPALGNKDCDAEKQWQSVLQPSRR
jgi:hypothetical protein